MAERKILLTEAMTVHLSEPLFEAIKERSFSRGITPSKWLRELADKELRNEYLQAQATIKALSKLGNSENSENSENYQNSFEGFNDEL